jgi:predicted O-methyltransferase YrrM
VALALPAVVRRNLPLLRLPPRVAIFYSRSRRTAARTRDEWSLVSGTPPESLALLLRLARGRRSVVEIGTGTAWTTGALALADPARRVLSFDPIVRPEREVYLGFLPPAARERIALVDEPGERDAAGRGVRPDFVFVDGSHDRVLTARTFEAWRPLLAPGAVMAFHDYGNASYPGVTEAIEDLGLRGEVVRDVFVWRAE